MLFAERLYMIGTLTALIVCLVLFMYAWMRRSTPGGRASAAMMFSVSFWLLANVVGWLSEDPNVQFFWERIGYLGVLTLPAGWFAFAMVLAGNERWVDRRRVAMLLIVPAFIFGLVITGVYFKDVRFIVRDGVNIHEVDYTGWLYLAMLYTYLLVGSGAFFMVRAVQHAPNLLRYQVGALLIAPFFPVLVNLIYLSRIVHMVYDLTPIAFAVSGLVLTWGLFHYRLFDLVPVARGAMVDRVSDGMIVVDALGRVADLNPAAQQILNVRAAQVISLPLVDLLPQLTETLSVVPARHAEIALERNGQLVYYEALATPLYAQRELLAGHLILLHDISARKQIESSLQTALDREREVNEIKSRFYSYFSHQLRTPLSVIMSSAEILDHYGREWPDDKRQRHFQRIYQAVDRLVNLAEKAAAHEQTEYSHALVAPVWFDPVALSHQLIDEMLVSDSDQHQICFEKQGPDLEAYQDSNLLRQVLENLLSNALKFSPQGSTIYFILDVTAEELCFSVKDQGCGIPQEELSRVTQPFYRGSNISTTSGTGLGLAIAAQYIQQIKGSLSLESGENKGTTAVVRLPLKLA